MLRLIANDYHYGGAALDAEAKLLLIGHKRFPETGRLKCETARDWPTMPPRLHIKIWFEDGFAASEPVKMYYRDKKYPARSRLEKQWLRIP